MKDYTHYLVFSLCCGLIFYFSSCQSEKPAPREIESVSAPLTSEGTKILKKPNEAKLCKQPAEEATVIRSDEVWQPLQMPERGLFSKYLFKEAPLVQYASFTSSEYWQMTFKVKGEKGSNCNLTWRNTAYSAMRGGMEGYYGQKDLTLKSSTESLKFPPENPAVPGDIEVTIFLDQNIDWEMRIERFAEFFPEVERETVKIMVTDTENREIEGAKVTLINYDLFEMVSGLTDKDGVISFKSFPVSDNVRGRHKYDIFVVWHDYVFRKNWKYQDGVFSVELRGLSQLDGNEITHRKRTNIVPPTILVEQGDKATAKVNVFPQVDHPVIASVRLDGSSRGPFPFTVELLPKEQFVPANEKASFTITIKASEDVDPGYYKTALFPDHKPWFSGYEGIPFEVIVKPASVE